MVEFRIYALLAILDFKLVSTLLQKLVQQMQQQANLDGLFRLKSHW